MINHQMVREVFLHYLKRLPSQQESYWHGNKTREFLINEILGCPEYLRLLSSSQSSNRIQSKIAILLSGHIRSNQFLKSINSLNGYNYDVFIHTWENMGFKGRETDLKDPVDRNLIESIIKGIPNVKSYKIENNENFILGLPENDNIYFNYSSPEKFIKSQLYSINQSFEVFDEYRIQNQTKYDLVLKLRFDSYIRNINLDSQIIDVINQNKIIFTPNNDCGHHHPDSDSTTCLSCEKLYKTFGKTMVHTFDHTHVICDLFAYGNVESMRHYCSLYNFYDIITKGFEERNIEILTKNNISYQIKDGVYCMEQSPEGHLNSLYYINCSYPERLLQFHLKDYILPSSEKIRIDFIR